ncbi:Lipoxygenase homology domain-containing protein 1 [Bagarius yarrelli]|uniref:Lipoxygenase homology domain-containing protein 1 n=1 Tax=Bagarius yarrelli TaxID=175774 RepID=A0A556TU52_BAGYA|nr:Lipoxygenase homology domain-containing protein 1 [Bagarius yarrelli]
MPARVKKGPEIEERDDRTEEKESKVKGKNGNSASQDAPDSEERRRRSESPTDKEEEKSEKVQKKKRETDDKAKKKKKKKREEYIKEDATALDGEDDCSEQNNNEPVKKEKQKKEKSAPTENGKEVKKQKEKKKKKKKKEAESEVVAGAEEGEENDDMERKGKDVKKKKKSVEEAEEDEDVQEEETEEEEDNKKKKKDKKKKKGSESDDEKKGKKGKKKNKQLDYSELYMQEILNYHTEDSDDYEDEYYKKKVYEVVTVTGDVKAAGTDANVFVTLYGDFGVTPKVLLASKWYLDRVTLLDMNRPHLRLFFACNRWLAREVGDGLTVRYLLGSLNPMNIPKRERKLVSEGKDTFERGNEDKFTIENPNLGRLTKITIGHNNKGSSAGWGCDKVVIDDLGNKEVYQFPVDAMFDIAEGDGKIQRDVAVGTSQPMAIVYNIQVMTGDIRGAGTNSKIHLVMYGQKGNKNSGKIFLEGGTFERAQIDIFNAEIMDLISPLSRVTIGHDNAGISCGWYCEKVTVYCPYTGIEQVFPCRRWLDEDVGDGLVEREMYEMVSLRKCKLKKFQWSLWIFTTDMKGAGTDAQIFIQVYGEKGKSDEIKLESKSDSFEQGQCDKFMILMPEIGKIRKLRIWHEKRHPFSGWHLDRVTLMKSLNREKYNFACNRWLDINEDDQEIIRELPATGVHVSEPLPLVKYRVTVCTGNITGSGTDASVHMSLTGDLGDTGDRFLFMSKTNVNKFEKGNTDEFVIEAVSLGTLNRVRIGHDGRGGGCGWFLDKVLIREEGQPEATNVEFPYVSYHIAIKTGSLSGASSDSKVFVKLYGEKGDTNKILLVASDTTHNNYFETAQTDIFTVETKDLGKINRLLIGHTNEGLQAGWFLSSVLIWVPVHGLQYTFPSHRWLCKDEADGKVEVEIYPIINYEVTVVTGEVFAAGTDAKVFLQIYGEEGKTEVIQLKSRSNNFERGTTEIFKIEALDVGRVYKIRIGHNGAGLAPGWFLEYVEVKRLIMAIVKSEKKEEKKDKKKKKKKRDEDEDQGELKRENTYEVHVYTGPMWGAGTDANIYINIYGEMGDTGERKLRKSNHFNKFERGQVDVFTLVAMDLGQLKKLRIRHDNKQASPGWYLERVEIMDMKEEITYYFPCQRWLAVDEDDGQLAPMSTTYTMRIKTGDRKNTGTDANVYTVLYGTNDDTGVINLKASKNHKNKFERCMIDEFTIEAVDLGSLKRIRIGHDNADVPYEIKIFTSDIFGAGTDANVFIVLYGQNGICTTQKSLCLNKRERCMYFERGAEDMFIVELEDIGDVIEKIRIGHDNSGIGGGWHLDRVEIRRLLRKGKGSETAIFPCECWLAHSEEDGEIIRELVPSDIIIEKLSREGTLKKIQTEVDDALESTDANVFITIYGDMGDSGERKLSQSENNRNKFERGAVDTFSIEAVDLGEVFKIRIRHDNSMLNADWYLDQVEVADTDTDEVFLFQCERWLSCKKEDKCIERVFYVKGFTEERDSTFCPIRKMTTLDSNMNKKSKKRVTEEEEEDEEEEEEPSLIPYHLTVKTGSDPEAGTNSRAYVIVKGSKQRQTELMWLELKGKSAFTPEALDYFTCYGRDVGKIKKVELGHDGATAESCWFVDEFSVAVPTIGIMYVFPCKYWLAKDRGEGLTSRVFNVIDADTISISRKVIYEVTVVTGDVQHAGTDTQIYITLFGVYGMFERCQTDTFNLEIEDIAPLRKMRVRIDGSGSRPDWFLDKIVLHNLETDEVALFVYEDWISRTYGSKRTLVCEMAAIIDDEEVVQLTTYSITVKTSDLAGAGTDANVWMIVFGENGDTGTLALKESENTNKFEQSLADTFVFTDMLSLGELSKVRVWHDNTGLAPGWHLESVDISDETLGKKFRFRCDRWLAKKEDDGQIMRELACANNDVLDFDEKTKYEVVTITADTDDAETKENAWIILEGRLGRSKELTMENSTKKKRFLRICLGHSPKDGKKSKSEALWRVEEVIITEKNLGNRYIFHCNTLIPLSSKRDEFQTFECTKFIESFASKARKLVPVTYELIVITGDEKGGGTDAKVFLTVFGTNSDSGRRHLKQKFRNLFERGRTDRFSMELLDLGEILRVCIEHDNSGISPGWLLDRVEITNTANGVTTVFPCDKWLDKNKADGKIKRVLYPKY